MARDPFAFLDEESPQRKTLLLLLALLRKQPDGQVELSLEDLTAIEDGASFHKYPSDTGTRLVLRFARRGAEAYFLSPQESQSSTPAKSRSTARIVQPPNPESEPPVRHAIHDDIDLALREDEMAARAKAAQQERLRKARAEAGAMPWRMVPPTQQ
jgi:hypothetical protein